LGKGEVNVNIRDVDGVAVLELVGRVTLGASVNAFRESLSLLHERGQQKIVLVLTQATFIDSAGLGVIVDGYNQSLAAGGTLKLVQPSTQVLRVLAVAGLDRVLQSYVYERDAISSFQEGIV
jgi:anti-anti-sigma factor